jgi:uncharacterized protein YjiS (DUF1127 family)
MLFCRFYRVAGARLMEIGRGVIRASRSHNARAALAALDRRTLADIGIGRGEVLSVALEIGFDRLRRSPHV